MDKRWHVRLEHFRIGKQEETFPLCTVSCMHSLIKFCDCIIHLANENKAQENFEISIIVGYHLDPVEKVTFQHPFQLIYLICCVLDMPIAMGLVSDKLKQKCESLFAHRDDEFKDMTMAVMMLVWKNVHMFFPNEMCHSSHCFNKLDSFTYCNEAKMFFAPQIPRMSQKGSVTLLSGKKTEKQNVRLVFREDLKEDYHPTIFALFRPGEKVGQMQFGLKNFWHMRGKGLQQRLSPKSDILEANVVILSMLKKSKIMEANFRRNQKVKETPTLKQFAERKAISFYSQKIWECNKNTIGKKLGEEVADAPRFVDRFLLACGKFLSVLEVHLKKHVGFQSAHTLTCHIFECFALKACTTCLDMKKGAVLEIQNCGNCHFCRA